MENKGKVLLSKFEVSETTAMKADVPTNFDKYELVNVKLVKSLTKNKGETNANNVSASTESQ